MDEALVQLIQAIRELSPEVWRIYIKQVYFDAFANGLVGGMLILLSAWSFKYAKRLCEDSEEFTLLFGLLYGIVGFLVIVLLWSSASYFYNPEYQVISKLLETIGGK